MMVTQARLESGTSMMTCWLDKTIKPGDEVTLKNSDDPKQWWTVVDTYATQDVSSINRGWNNNILCPVSSKVE
jgi:DNA-binding sugar fermentation-stimulating protein